MKVVKWSKNDADICDATERQAVYVLYNGEHFKTVLNSNESTWMYQFFLWKYNVSVHLIFPSLWRNSPQLDRASSFKRFLNHTTTHHSRQDSSGRVISPSQRPLPDNPKHSKQTSIHAPSGIRTHISADKRPQTCTLDRAATGVG